MCRVHRDSCTSLLEQLYTFLHVCFIKLPLSDVVNIVPCPSHTGDGTVQYENLSLGEHRVKVRPNGSNCVRRIRRTVEFTVI